MQRVICFLEKLVAGQKHLKSCSNKLWRSSFLTIATLLLVTLGQWFLTKSFHPDCFNPFFNGLRVKWDLLRRSFKFTNVWNAEIIVVMADLQMLHFQAIHPLRLHPANVVIFKVSALRNTSQNKSWEINCESIQTSLYRNNKADIVLSFF